MDSINVTANEGDVRWDWMSMPSGGGVMAISEKTSGRSYLVGVANFRQRAYDHHRLLKSGGHHNKALQAAFRQTPADFEFVAVEPVKCAALLKLFTQVWIERSKANSFNRKNALSRPPS